MNLSIALAILLVLAEPLQFRGASSPTDLKGDIDAGFVSALASMAETSGHVRVSSGGGSAESALAAARILSERDIHLRIDRYCLSACAEFLVPAAVSVSLGREAVLGFHGNDIAYTDIALGLGANDSCSAKRLPELLRYYARHGLQPAFAQEVERRLGRRVPTTERTDGGCSKVVSTTDIAYWYPTSAQLSSLWGLQVVDEICADRMECMQAKVFPITDEGDIVVIGDSVYIAEGEGFRFLRPFEE